MTITSPCIALLEESSASRHALTSARPEYTGTITSTTRVEAADAPDLRELLNVEPSIRSRDSPDQSMITTPQSPARESRGESVVREHIAKRGFLNFTGGGVWHLIDVLHIIGYPPLGNLAIEIGLQLIGRGILAGRLHHD